MKKLIEKYKRKQIIRFLTRTSPEKLTLMGSKKIIPSFQALIKKSPAYNTILSELNINPKKIKTIGQFKQLPVLNKGNFFSKYPTHKLLGKQLHKIKLTMTSSGFSNTFAYGFHSEKAVRKLKLGVDTTFDYWFNISDRKSLFINCMPMGLHVETSLAMAEVSVRSDMAIALLKKVAPYYEQTIIVGDPHFIKKLAEEGVNTGINWKELNINIITGQDWLPENLRSYLAHIFGIDMSTNNQRGIYATMGSTEMGLNTFHESFYTVNLRRTIMNDNKLKQLLGIQDHAAPCVFHYYPFQTYIEQTGGTYRPELLFTTLNNDNLLPLIRYTTGDTGTTLSYKELREIIHNDYGHLLPDLNLPICLVYGRVHTSDAAKPNIQIENIKEGLYSNWDIIPQITGLMGISYSGDVPVIQIHLNKGVSPAKALANKLEDEISNYVNAHFKVKTISYSEFPSALSLDYEHKFKVIS